MPMYDLVCEAGHLTQDVWARVDERHRPCPTCGGPTTTAPLSKAASVADVTWPGGRTFENLGHEPQTFYAPSDFKRYLRNHRLEEFVRHVPLQDSDKNPHTVNWSSVSPATLTDACALLERVGRAASTAEAPPPSYVASLVVTTTQKGR